MYEGDNRRGGVQSMLGRSFLQERGAAPAEEGAFSGRQGERYWEEASSLRGGGS